MATTPETKPTADEIADDASGGEDVSAHFTNEFTVVRPVAKTAANRQLTDLPNPSTAHSI